MQAGPQSPGSEWHLLFNHWVVELGTGLVRSGQGATLPEVMVDLMARVINLIHQVQSSNKNPVGFLDLVQRTFDHIFILSTREGEGQIFLLEKEIAEMLGQAPMPTKVRRTVRKITEKEASQTSRRSTEDSGSSALCSRRVRLYQSKNSGNVCSF